MTTRMRVIFDTNTVISALLFTHGRLSWLRQHWSARQVIPLVSKEIAEELLRVLAYPKFRLDKQDIEVLLADFLPFAETVTVPPAIQPIHVCGDPHDQCFIDLGLHANADILVTGDSDLLVMNDTPICIETAADYKKRWLA